MEFLSPARCNSIAIIKAKALQSSGLNECNSGKCLDFALIHLSQNGFDSNNQKDKPVSNFRGEV